MLLLKEHLLFEYTREPVENRTIVKGILQKADTLNQNGRIYPKKILLKELENYQKKIRENQALGELDHFDRPIIEMKTVSHVIREAWMDDAGVVWGRVEILDTPCGKILKTLIDAGINPGISSRALGTVKRQGDVMVVQEDLQLLCWDFVSEPSTPGAYMALSEAKEIDPEILKTVLSKSDRIDRIANDILNFIKQ